MSTVSPQHTCENCNNQFAGAFCNSCGQKVAHRITMPHILHDVAHAFTHADKGFLNLLLQLFVRPGVVAREYILEKKRKKYYNPFQFILIIGSIAAFVAINTHFAETTMEAMGPGTVTSQRVLNFQHAISKYMGKYYNFLVLLQLPFFALGSFLVYRKYKYNYAEHLTLQTFITAQSTILGMLTMILIGTIGKTGVYFSFLMAPLNMGYQVLAFIQFFGERSFMGVLKGIAAYLVAYACFMTFLVLVMVITVIVLVKFQH
ncbi:MAG TPA: DUF3667 domain-containing protein [Chitinophagaceae bacterium]|nr:DUF3667 domain-containing protein [Chitinophagaceae bacterium]